MSTGTDQPQAGSIDLDAVDEASRQAGVEDALRVKAQEQAEKAKDAVKLEPVDEAGRQAAIDAFHAKGKAKAERADDAIEIKKAPMNSLREKMEVAIVFKDKTGATWIHPSMFRIKGVWANGRVNLKVIKRR